MEQRQQKKRPWLLFLVLLVGFICIGFWQTTAKSTDIKSGEQILKDLSPEEFHKLIQEREDDETFVILDVRTPREFEAARLENSVNIDYYGKNFKGELAKLDKGKTYLVYCRSGNRSGRSLKLMKELGFQEVYNMSGGIGTWAAKKLPITK